MTLVVRDNNTNKVLNTYKTNEFAIMYGKRDTFRRMYTNATVEVHYSDEIDDKPTMKDKTYH